MLNQNQAQTNQKRWKMNAQELDYLYHSQVCPVWEVVREIGNQIPASEWQQIPANLAKNI